MRGAAHDVLGQFQVHGAGGFQIHRIRHLAREGRSKGRRTGPAEDFPGELEMTAWSMDRPRGQEVMALRHRIHPQFGVQFHPESIATEAGRDLLSNFLRLAAVWRTDRAAAIA